MSIVKRSSAEMKQELFTNLRRLTDTAHFDYWPVLVNLAKGARLDKDVVDFMVNDLSKRPKIDFEQMLVNGGFGGRYIPDKNSITKFTIYDHVPPITSEKEFYNFLEANNVLGDKKAYMAISTFALYTNIESLKKFASTESLIIDAIKRE